VEMSKTIDLGGRRRAERALIMVRNPCTHDARVLREAGTLSRLGYSPMIVAVVSEQTPTTRSTVDGVAVVRLAPTSPLAWARSLWSGSRTTSHRGEHGERIPERSARADGRPHARLAVRIHRWIRTLDYYRRAIRLAREQRPALVHCNDYNTMWVGVIVRLLTGARVIYDAHELWPDRNQRPEPRWWLLACEFLFVRCASRTITASPGYAGVMARRYRIEAPMVVRNIPEETRGRVVVPSDVADDGGTPVAVYAGAITSNRGIEVSIRALAGVPQCRLRLMGPVSPAYRDRLEALAREHGVSERIEFAAPAAPTRVVAAIDGAAVGLALIQPVCLSYRMSLPNKLFEYMHAAVPVLASDLPVIGNFVREHSIGLVARPDDPEDIAAKLEELLRAGPNRRFSESARKAAAEMRWSDESGLLADAYGRPSDAN
jgi:glycosyltransferase involved in cell wall biosynthesis